jgi:protein-disulfide isomerase
MSSRGLFGASLGLAAVFAAALIAASVVGARTGEEPRPTASAAKVDRGVLRGIPQDGAALGSPKAPITLVEYADLQCPFCAQWARTAFPELVRDYVKTGRVRIVFRGLAFLGPDSETALRSALAAGRQDRLWDLVHALYSVQGPENGGWVTEDLFRRLGAGIAGLDAQRMLDERWKSDVQRELDAAAAAARSDGIPGTPAFFAGPTRGKLHPVSVSSLEAAAFRPHLDKLLAR